MSKRKEVKMKKTIALATAGILALSLAVFSPPSLGAHDVDHCFRDHEICRQNAMNMEAPWYMVMLYLSACDVALGVCIFKV
jgi:hypothetical protein